LETYKKKVFQGKSRGSLNISPTFLFPAENLSEQLCNTSLNFENDSVQEYWNSLENVIINVTDSLAPLATFRNVAFTESYVPRHIKAKVNQRDRLLKTNKLKNCPEISNKIKDLNKSIKYHFFQHKAKKIKNKISTNNTNDLWKAVKIAKNQNFNDIPTKLTLNDVDVPFNNVSNAFAGYFHEKIEKIKNKMSISGSVYNGKNKLIVDSRFFMGEFDIRCCMSSIKPKICEGYDRIPLNP
jgi:hypothetical protein